MKDILIIDHFSQTPDEHGNNRFIYFADMLAGKGYNVEIVTTDFSHKAKKTRELPDAAFSDLSYKYTMLKEPGYNKNVSLKRFYSHYMFGKSLSKYLKDRKKPDIVYISVPSLDVGYVAAKYCKKNKIPLIVDIQDLWPEAFQMVFDVPLIKDIVFYPLKRKAEIAYKAADKLIAVSDTYLKRGLLVNNRDKEGLCVFLGTDLEAFDEAMRKFDVIKPRDEIQIVYIGTLGHSYNINLVSDALAILKEKGYENIVFTVVGDGPKIDDFKAYALKLNINCKFTGRVKYNEMIGYLKSADIAVNPITKGAAQSIINKHGDYAAAGLPVVNTQENAEYKSLLQKYKCGINCESGTAQEVADAIRHLIDNPSLSEEMGKNSRIMAEDLFDRCKTYKRIVMEIDKILS